MLSIADAKKIILKNLPGSKIEKYVAYKNLFVIQAFYGDPLESNLDSFYSVDRVTGVLNEFPLMLPEHFSTVMGLFEKG